MKWKAVGLIFTGVLLGIVVGWSSFTQADSTPNFNNGNGQGVSVKQLAELVMEQQETIEQLQGELSNIQSELDDLKENGNSD